MRRSRVRTAGLCSAEPEATPTPAARRPPRRQTASRARATARFPGRRASRPVPWRGARRAWRRTGPRRSAPSPPAARSSCRSSQVRRSIGRHRIRCLPWVDIHEVVAGPIELHINLVSNHRRSWIPPSSGSRTALSLTTIATASPTGVRDRQYARRGRRWTRDSPDSRVAGRICTPAKRMPAQSSVHGSAAPAGGRAPAMRGPQDRVSEGGADADFTVQRRQPRPTNGSSRRGASSWTCRSTRGRP